MSALNEDQIDAAEEIAREVVNDPDTNQYAKQYARALLDGRVASVAKAIGDSKEKGIETQLRYLQNNVNGDRAEEIAEILGEASEQGYKLGYCQICGNRDETNAYHGDDEDAVGLVCEGCHEDFGGPQECEDCGRVTYEGDEFVDGPREGEFYCNSCLLAI